MARRRGTDYEEKKYKAYGSWYPSTWKTDEEDERFGYVETPNGTVKVFQWIRPESIGGGEETRIYFRFDGEEYIRIWRKFYTKKFVKCLANRMTSDILQGKLKGRLSI